MTRSSLFVLLGSALVSACFAGEPPNEEIAISAQELASSVGLDADHRCGSKVVKFRPNDQAPKRHVFQMPDANTWHKNNPCLGDLLEAAKKQPTSAPIYDLLYHQTLYILSNPNVRLYVKGGKKKKLAQVTNSDGELQLSKLDRLVYWNEHQLAYDSMSQVDFGHWLLGAARALIVKQHPSSHYRRAFETLGLAALEVITDPVADDGLRSRSICEKKPNSHCSWFHSVTKRDLKSTTAGATLNKGLHPVRDLHRSAAILEEIDAAAPDPTRAAKIEKLETASREGVYQLVYGSRSTNGSPPNLFDFFARKDGKPIQRSWLYYGFRTDLDKGYFLNGEDGPWKNCNYHFHVMELLAKILPAQEAAGADLSGFRDSHAALGMSVLDFIVKTYEEKLADGLAIDSKGPAPGMFGGCGARELDDGVDQILRDF